MDLENFHLGKKNQKKNKASVDDILSSFLILSLLLILSSSSSLLELSSEKDIKFYADLKQGQVGQRCVLDCLDFHWFILLIDLFIYLLIFLFIYLPNYLFIFIYLFIYSFICFWPRRIHSPGSMVHAVSRSRVSVCLSVCLYPTLKCFKFLKCLGWGLDTHTHTKFLKFLVWGLDTDTCTHTHTHKLSQVSQVSQLRVGYRQTHIALVSRT